MGELDACSGASVIGAGFRSGATRAKPNPTTGHHQWAESKWGVCDRGEWGDAIIHLFESAAVCDSRRCFAGMGMFRSSNRRLAFKRVAAVDASHRSAGAASSSCSTRSSSSCSAACGCVSAAWDGDLPTTVSCYRYISCSRGCRSRISPWGVAGCSGDQRDRQDCKRRTTGAPVWRLLLLRPWIPAMVI
jgi:hypothetical protein